MATFDHRIGPDGKIVYRVRIRRKGYATQAKKYTLTDLIDRYICEALPHKRPSTIPDQIRQLHWWQTHLGHFLLANITPALVVKHRTILTQGRANGTVNRYLAVLSHSSTVAVEE